MLKAMIKVHHLKLSITKPVTLPSTVAPSNHYRTTLQQSVLSTICITTASSPTESPSKLVVLSLLFDSDLYITVLPVYTTTLHSTMIHAAVVLDCDTAVVYSLSPVVPVSS